MGRSAILCPHCRQIIGSEEAVCSWCGASRSNPWWNLLNILRGPGRSDWIIRAILTLNILYFAVSLLLSTRIDGSVGFLSPGQNSLLMLGATGTIPIDRFGRIWSLVSANYLHGGILHLIFNLMALRQLGPWVSTEYGTSRMVAIYTLGGCIGYAVSYLAGVQFTAGASAAVCSLIGALLYFAKSRGGVYGSSVYREVGGWVVSLFIFGFLFPGINNWAHGGGILGGIGLAAVLGYNERRPENSFHLALGLFCGVITMTAMGWALFGARI